MALASHLFEWVCHVACSPVVTIDRIISPIATFTAVKVIIITTNIVFTGVLQLASCCQVRIHVNTRCARDMHQVCLIPVVSSSIYMSELLSTHIFKHQTLPTCDCFNATHHDVLRCGCTRTLTEELQTLRMQEASKVLYLTGLLGSRMVCMCSFKKQPTFVPRVPSVHTKITFKTSSFALHSKPILLW